MWWLKPLVGLGMSAVAQNQQKAPPKYARTEDEQTMVNTLQQKSEAGFNVGERLRQRSRPVLDIRDEGKQGAWNRAYSRGMQGSIITDELMRKLDLQAQEQISSMSNEIAVQNQNYKDQYEGKLHSFYQQEGNKERQSEQQQHQFKMQERQNYANMGTSFVNSFMSRSPFGQRSGTKKEPNKFSVSNWGASSSNGTGTFDLNSPNTTSVGSYKIWLSQAIAQHPNHADVDTWRDTLANLN